MENNDVLLKDIHAALIKLQGETPLAPPDDFAQRIAQAMQRDQSAKRLEELAEMKAPPKPQVSPLISYGNITATVGPMIALLTLFWYFSAEQTTLKNEMIASSKRAEKYIPLIEKGDAVNAMQSERIDSVIDSVRELRKFNADVNAVLGNIREDLATIKTKLDVSGTRR